MLRATRRQSIRGPALQECHHRQEPNRPHTATALIRYEDGERFHTGRGLGGSVGETLERCEHDSTEDLLHPVSESSRTGPARFNKDVKDLN